MILLGEKVDVIRVMIYFQLGSCCWTWVIDIVDLLVQPIAHYKCISERESMRFHRMPFLSSVEVYEIEAETLDEINTYSIMMFPDALWKIIGDDRPRVRLLDAKNH